jgi:hypothetical protein
LLEQRRDLNVVGMVDLNGNADAALRSMSAAVSRTVPGRALAPGVTVRPVT